MTNVYLLQYNINFCNITIRYLINRKVCIMTCSACNYCISCICTLHNENKVESNLKIYIYTYKPTWII